LDYLLENIAQWMARDDVGKVVLPNLLEFAYKTHNQKLMNECLEWMNKIEDGYERFETRIDTGVQLLTIGENELSLKLITQSFTDLKNSKDHNRTPVETSSLIRNLMKIDTKEARELIITHIRNIESFPIKKDMDINNIHANIELLGRLGEISSARELIKKIENYINDIEDKSMFELAYWYIASGSLLIGDIEKYRKNVKIAMDFGSQRENGISLWMNDYCEGILTLLAEKELQDEMDIMWQRFSEMDFIDGDENDRRRYNDFRDEIIIKFICSYLVLIKKNDNTEYREWVYNYIKGFSVKSFWKFCSALMYEYNEVLTEELLNIIEKCVTNYKPIDMLQDKEEIPSFYFDDIYSYVGRGYCYLYSIKKNEKQIQAFITS